MDIIHTILNASFRIVDKNKIALIFEEVHLKKFFKHYSVDCVFDVGANNGQYATMLRKKVGYKGPIISFEPIPEAAKILKENAERDPQWYVEEVALDTTNSTAVFNIMFGNQFSSLHTPTQSDIPVFQQRNKVIDQVSVQTATLNDMFEKYKDLLNFERPFLKMDTQGHDLTVAKSGEKNLSSFVGIQSELSIVKLYEDSPDYHTVIEYYKSHGFELSAFVPNNQGHFPRLIEIDCIMYNKIFNF